MSLKKLKFKIHKEYLQINYLKSVKNMGNIHEQELKGNKSDM